MKLPTIKQVLESQGTHEYLKDALRVFSTKDPVDALHDAELLAALMRERFAQLTRAGQPSETLFPGHLTGKELYR